MPPTPDAVDAVSPKTKLPGESLIFGCDFTRLLKPAETLTAVVSILCSNNDGTLTIGAATVNAATFYDDSLPALAVAIGMGVQCTISGGTSPTAAAIAAAIAAGTAYAGQLLQINGVWYTAYLLQILVTTSNAQTRGVDCTLLVRG